MAAKNTREGSSDAERFAPCFASAKPRADDSEISEFSFCHASLRIDERHSFDAELTAMPTLSHSRGLEFKLTLSASLCEPDDCSDLFHHAFGPTDCKALLTSKSPLSDAFLLRPKLMEKALAAAPGLREALCALECADVAQALQKATPPAAATRQPPRI